MDAVLHGSQLLPEVTHGTASPLAKPHCAGRAVRPRGWPAWLDGGLLALLALPLVLLALDSNWIYGLLVRDPWLYFGYYLDLPGHLRTFDGLYYGSRLSVILPGWLAYQALPPFWANHFLHLGQYEISVVALYLVLKETVTRRAAFLAALCLGCHSFFLTAVGWDYTDGYGITYCLLTTWLLTRAASSTHWRWWLLGAGTTAAALGIANLVYVYWLPFLIGYYLLANRDRSRHSVCASLCYLGLGAGALTLSLCVVNWLVVGRFWFLGPSFKFAKHFTKQASTPFKAASPEWLWDAYWLVAPAVVAVGGLVYCFWLWRRATSGAARVRKTSEVFKTSEVLGSSENVLPLYFQLQLLALLSLLALYELTPLGCILEFWFYVSMLLPAVFLALGGQLGPWLRELSSRQFRWLALTAGLLLIGAAIIPATGMVTPLPLPTRWLPLMLGLGAVMILRLRPGLSMALAFVVLWGLAQAAAWHGFEAKRLVRMRHYPERSAILGVMLESMRAVQEVDATGEVYFWFNIQEQPHGWLFDNIACTYHGWGPRNVNPSFPAIHPDGVIAAGKLTAGMKLAILSTEPDAANMARQSLSKIGFATRLLAQQQIERGSIAFLMTFVEIVARQPPDAGGGLSTEQE